VEVTVAFCWPLFN